MRITKFLSCCSSPKARKNPKLEINDTLLQEALMLSGEHRTEKAVVEEALQEYVQRRKQLKILDFFGAIDYDPAYNYKQQRRQG